MSSSTSTVGARLGPMEGEVLSAPDRARATRGVWLAALVLVVAGALAYANSFTGEFVFDDCDEIASNLSVRQLWPVSDVLLNRAGRLASRPIPYYTFAMNYAVHGDDVWGYHLVNLAIHIGSALMLMGLVRRTLLMPRFAGRFDGASLGLGLTVALLWMLHPLQTESVTYVYQRIESLMGFFFLAMFYTFVRAQSSKRPWAWLVLSVLACALGMGSKEVMAVGPLLLLWYDRVFIAQSWQEIARRRGLYYFGLGLTYIALAASFISQLGRYHELDRAPCSPLEYFCSQPAVLVHYLRLCFWPTGQCLDYMWPVAKTWDQIVPAGLVIVSLLGLTAWAMVKWPSFGFLGGWFFLILAPTSTILPVAALAFEHRMYLPLIAVVSVVVVALYLIVTRWLPRGMLADRRIAFVSAAVVAVVAVALGWATYVRNRVYLSAGEIWADVVVKAEHNDRGWTRLGYHNRTNLAFSRRCYEKAIELKPNSSNALSNLGALLARLGEADEAVEYLERALAADTGNARARTILAAILMDRGDYLTALGELERAVRDQPRLFEARVNLANAYSGLGRFDEAVKHYRVAHQLVPDERPATLSLAGALISVDRASEAEAICRSMLAQEPNLGLAHVNLAYALMAQGRSDEALTHFRLALAADARIAEAHAGIANILTPRDHEGAVKEMAEAVRLNPKSMEINLGMGDLLLQDRPEEAITYYEAALKLQSSCAEALFNMASALVATGQRQKAIACLERVAQLRPDWEDAQERLRVLRSKTD